jgi:hypothetical protein
MWGPPRQFWCFGYEAKNQEIKKAAASSNFKDVVGTAMRSVSFQAARSLKRRRRVTAAEDAIALD